MISFVRFINNLFLCEFIHWKLHINVELIWIFRLKKKNFENITEEGLLSEWVRLARPACSGKKNGGQLTIVSFAIRYFRFHSISQVFWTAKKKYKRLKRRQYKWKISVLVCHVDAFFQIFIIFYLFNVYGMTL